jgi:hypothetical protein
MTVMNLPVPKQKKFMEWLYTYKSLGEELIPWN